MLFRLLNIFRAGVIGKIMIMLADAGARNRTIFERIARFIVGRVFTVPKQDDFMADAYVDNDEGFDLEELRRYQSGK
ncbi:MAG: hypothetical protein ABJN26_09900 [Stappiaceae bacterium]